MQKTFTFNPVDNAVVVKKALGAEPAMLQLMFNKSCSTFGGRHNEEEARATWPKEDVPVITLDSYVDQHSLQIGLIKVDVEGFEQPLLHGAINTIKSQKPILLISIYHNLDDFFMIKPLIESWNLGYSFKIVKPVNGSIIGETMLIAQSHACSAS